MNRYRRTVCCLIIFILSITAAATAEMPTVDAEQGLEEIQPLMEMAEIKEQEGMSLEEMTDAFTESAMSEYLDSVTGFSMQYPVIFLFDEAHPESMATTADKSAYLSIDNMINQNGLDEEAIINAIKLETPDTEIQKNTQNGCLRTDRITEEGKTGQTDLYLLTKHSFHHIVISYPIQEQGTFFSYIEYMINTMETNETDLG